VRRMLPTVMVVAVLIPLTADAQRRPELLRNLDAGYDQERPGAPGPRRRQQPHH
jgi:hypothetical protein